MSDGIRDSDSRRLDALEYFQKHGGLTHAGERTLAELREKVQRSGVDADPAQAEIDRLTAKLRESEAAIRADQRQKTAQECARIAWRESCSASGMGRTGQYSAMYIWREIVREFDLPKETPTEQAIERAGRGEESE